MAIGHKGTRGIIVGGRRYRWSGSLGEGPYETTQVVVEAWENPRQRLIARFDPWTLTGERPAYLSQRFVRMVIVEGLRRGWDPDRAGAQRFLGEDELWDASPIVRTPVAPVPPELLAAVHADPDADPPRLVLADWLLEHGDRRGELIVLQCAVQHRLPPDGKERIASLLRRYWRRWSAPAHRAARRWSFERGFIAQVSCWRVPDRSAWEELHRLEPVQRVELVVGRELASASSWIVQPTTRELATRGEVGDGWVAALLASNRIGGLRRLELESGGLSDAAALALAQHPALRGLEGLALRFNRIGATGVGALLESPQLASLRQLQVDRDHLPRALLHELEARGL